MAELRHLRYFIALAEELHFGNAAQRLHIAQPGLTQQIKALEEELGVQLFYRTRRRVELTHAGATLLQEGRRALAEVERAFTVAQRAGFGEVGTLRIGATESPMDILPSIIREFRRAHPNVDLVVKELSSPIQIQALRNGDIDVGLVRSPINTQGLVALTIREEPLGVFLPEEHPLAKRRKIAISDLEGVPLIIHPGSPRPSWADFMIGVCRGEGFEPVISQESNETATAVGFVAAGLGVTLVPSSLQGLGRPGVVYRPVAAPSPVTGLQVVHRKGVVPATIPSLVRITQEVARKTNKKTAR